VLEKSLKILEFGVKNSRPFKIPEKSLGCVLELQFTSCGLNILALLPFLKADVLKRP